MTVQTLARIIDGKMSIPCPEIEIGDIQTDTRNLKEGDVYIAITGKNMDGHDFIKNAIEKGASAIVVSKFTKIDTSTPIIYVENTIHSLAKIAQYYRKNYPAYAIAITGSVGKTTTRELLYTILSSNYTVLKSEKNYNNHIGVPLTLLRLNHDYNIILLEMGMNHMGEIEYLSNMVKPDLSVITNIGTSHIGNLGSKKKIFDAKMEITAGMKDGILFVNGDDSFLKKLKNTEDYRVIKCGRKQAHTLVPYDIQEELDHLSFKVRYQNQEYVVTVPVTGKHFLTNILIAMEIGLFLHIDIQTMIDSLKHFESFTHRMNVIQTDEFTVIDDCYNASYESFKSVCHFLKNRKEEKILVVGDILELGKFSQKIHKKLKKKLAKIPNATILSVGDATKIWKGKNIIHFENVQELITYLARINKKNKLILLKGSRGMHLEEIKNYLVS